jgi:tryptophan 2,3-dioxygenase
MEKNVNYNDYLSLDTLLALQQTESSKAGKNAHDEMLFIVIHQAYELWFKQILFELDSVTTIMAQPTLNDNSAELQTVVHRLDRIVTILKLAVQQIEVMETMTAMDFLDFRDLLRPASGFQSWQFKLIEARLGLKFEARHGGHYYTSQLCPAHIDHIKQGEATATLLDLVNNWLERMPAFVDENFWSQYAGLYGGSLREGEQNNLKAFEDLLRNGNQLSGKAVRAALLIQLYPGYPILQLPYRLLNVLLEIDEQLSIWRYRHMHMVSRVIGSRQGTGGSTGAAYLKGASEKHIIFRSISELNSYLIERSQLPVLQKTVEQKLGYFLM